VIDSKGTVDRSSCPKVGCCVIMKEINMCARFFIVYLFAF